MKLPSVAQPVHDAGLALTHLVQVYSHQVRLQLAGQHHDVCIACGALNLHCSLFQHRGQGPGRNTTKRGLSAVGQGLSTAGSHGSKSATAKDFQLQQWKINSQGHGSWKNLTLVNKNGVQAAGISPGRTITYKFRLAVRTTALSGLDLVGIRVTTVEGSQAISTTVGDYWGQPNWDCRSRRYSFHPCVCRASGSTYCRALSACA